jgi:hypothetical protein
MQAIFNPSFLKKQKRKELNQLTPELSLPHGQGNSLRFIVMVSG